MPLDPELDVILKLLNDVPPLRTGTPEQARANFRLFTVDLRDPAEDVTAIDTTGAGDVFVGAFLAEWLQSRDYARAARVANRAAGESVARPGVLS